MLQEVRCQFERIHFIGKGLLYDETEILIKGAIFGWLACSSKLFPQMDSTRGPIVHNHFRIYFDVPLFIQGIEIVSIIVFILSWPRPVLKGG
jgi:hypothetical protein